MIEWAFLVLYLLSGIVAVIHYEGSNARVEGTFSDGSFIGVLMLNPLYWLSLVLTQVVRCVYNRRASKAQRKESNGTTSRD